MTENEAIERLECMRLFMQIEDERNESKFLEDDYIANEMSIQALQKVQQFEAIGTIEEFKALKEKSVANKPKKSGVTDNKGVFHAINGINGVPYDLCPNCEINLCTDGMFGGNKSGMKYCKNCGQKLDWSE